MKIFHSMPLNGRGEKEIAENSARDHEIIRAYFEGVDSVVDILPTLLKDNIPDDATPLWFFGEGIAKYLYKADVLVMSEGWEKARGCRAEQYIASAYGIPLLYILGDTISEKASIDTEDE
jgi:hypothetical protein